MDLSTIEANYISKLDNLSKRVDRLERELFLNSARNYDNNHRRADHITNTITLYLTGLGACIGIPASLFLSIKMFCVLWKR